MGPLFTLLEVKLHKLSGVGHVIGFCHDDIASKQQADQKILHRLGEESSVLADEISSLRTGLKAFGLWSETRTVDHLGKLLSWLCRECFDHPLPWTWPNEEQGQAVAAGDLALEILLGMIYWEKHGVVSGIALTQRDRHSIALHSKNMDQKQLSRIESSTGVIPPMHQIFKNGEHKLRSVYLGKKEVSGLNFMLHDASTFELVLKTE